jgi:Na+/proline symporter
VFDGFDDIYVKQHYLIILIKKNTIVDLSEGNQLVFLCVLSMFVIFLARQFHTAIVENNKETHIRTAIFSHCIYYFNNIFVFPIALAATSF